MKIESKGGVHTTHDGLDHGDDDEELLLDEQEASQEGIGGRGLVTQTGLVVREALREESRAGDDLDDQDADDHEHLAEREEDDREEPEYRYFDGTRAGDDFSQGAQQPAPSSPHERVAGTIMTEGGPIDVSMAADYPFSADDATNAASSEDDNTGGTASSKSQPVREPELPELQIDTQRRTAGTRRLQPDAASPLPATTPPTTTSAAARSSGRPRSSRKKPLPTSATPDGPHLQRNPQ
ncbi:hypothetical protein PR002_g17233 [Phytophthora rubi]|nr:hypothetical protein PR002_g17233 [Phytophthora rubi]